MHQHSIHSLTERCKSNKYPVIKLGLDEHGPFRRMNLGQEHDDLLYELHCRAIEMYSDHLIDYSSYTVNLKYKDKDGEDCMIISGDELVEAIKQYQGSASFKVVARVKEKGKEPICRVINLRQDHNAFERREDSGDRDSMNSCESRDGRGDVSALTEPPKMLLKMSATSSRRRRRRKSIFRFFKRNGVAADSLKTDEASSIISSPVGTGKDNDVALSPSEPTIVLYNDCGGIGASYSVSCLSVDHTDETN